MTSTRNQARLTGQAKRFTLLGGQATDDDDEFAHDVRTGLEGTRKSLSCRFLYDERGSKLFEEICEQPEYYPTRVEAEILERIAPELAATFEEPPRLVELGSGSAEKTQHLIRALIERHGSLVFEPIDISRTALEDSAELLLEEFDDLEVRAIAAEYVPGLQLLAESDQEQRTPWLVAWLGSSIGNFHRADAVAFLRELRQELRPEDSLLIGFDMRKEPAVLEAAYDDAAGVTSAFIGNLLVRVNSEFDADFEPDRFRYRAHYNKDLGRVEMSLISTCAQQVKVPALNLEVAFDEGEVIHIENSHKYSESEIEELAAKSGLRVAQHWSDEQNRFRVVLLRT